MSSFLPWRVHYFLRCASEADGPGAAMRFLSSGDLPITRAARLALLRDFYRIGYRVWCAHTQAEMIAVATAILKVPRSVDGVIVEAGCYKGGSTTKFSKVAKLTGRKIEAYDSFEGLPDNDESGQQTSQGETADFTRGRYRGAYEEVESNLRRFGDLPSCELIKGWFDETMPGRTAPIVAAFIDVDLVSSTRTCLRYLYPRLQPGCSLFSQDGHLPLIVELLDDERFWQVEVGCPKPRMVGLNTSKLVEIVKSPM
jgi:O-methyltransferase